MKLTIDDVRSRFIELYMLLRAASTSLESTRIIMTGSYSLVPYNKA